MTATFRELGLDIDELERVYRPYTMRPDKNIGIGGTRKIEEVGFYQGDYADWFKDLGPATQELIVGKKRFAALKAKQIGFKDMVDKNTGELKTVEELLAR